MVWLLDGRNKEIASAATTYKALQNIVDEIAACSYPESKPAEVEEEVVPSAEPIVSICFVCIVCTLWLCTTDFIGLR